MKKGLLTFILLALVGLAGNMKVMAQTPEPTAKWTFENTDNLMAPSVGSLQMIPAIVSNNSISLATIGEASITTATGPTEGKRAIKVPRSSALMVVRAEGAKASQSYSLMMDVMAPDASPWNSLLQTAEGNDNDGDLFIHDNKIGIASLGGYFGNIRNNKWHRVVLSYRDGENILYVDGKKLATANPDNNDRFKIQAFGFYLFCDEDGEVEENYVSEVAFWETPLTDKQVSELGTAAPPTFMEIATPADLSAFAEAVESGADVNGKLTADIDLSESDYPDLMIGTDGNPFMNIFDGGGHTITYHYEGDCVAEKWRGLFRAVNGATIRNLRVEGEAYPTNIHFGALIGVAYGTVLVENVVTNVDITGQRNNVTGDAGMLGANYADIIFNNCAVLGPMGYPGSSMYSPYSGWSDGNSSVTLNNCYAACEFKEGTIIDNNSATLTHGGTTSNYFNNCYYLNYIDKLQGTQVTEGQIASGSLCFKLNSDQTEIVWTQDIGVDPYPMPDPNGPRVYGSGTLRCDGTEIPDNPLTYSNTESYPVIPDHQYGMDGICTVCGMTDPNAVTQDAEGYYLIGNREQLYWLYLKIQENNEAIKVKLTDDIDLSESNFSDLMLGTEARPFIGIFDGGMHTITYNYENVTEQWRGLFADVKDATIRNLRVEGSAYVTYIHFGALIGHATGTVLVENVVTNVDIIGARTNVTGDGGMIGANYANLTFTNCSTHGEMGYPGSSMYSPFSGFSSGNFTTTLNNCYTTCSFTEGTIVDTNSGTLTHKGGTNTINNSYYLNPIGKYVTGTQITEEELASGKLCFKLNGDQSSIGWYQTLGEDEMPVPDATHLRVYGAGGIFMNVTDESSFNQFVNTVIDAENNRLEETIAQQSLITTYLNDLENLKNASNIEAFITGYNALEEQRQAIQSSADAYAAYIAKVEETKTYLEANPQLKNEKVDFLKTYLEDLEEPGEEYPNGSVAFILDNCLLNEEEIAAETTLIDEWLTEAISYKPAPGTDVSLFFTNIDLSDRFEGWEGTVPTGWGTSDTSPLYAAECLAAKMDMYQTVTDLPNGIYELKINGAFRPTPYNNWYNVNYAATLYANDIHNFFQANIEDMIPASEAIDGENCNINGPIADFPIYDETGEEVIGYTMQGIVSCCNAFQADRYPNYVLCNVTDGQLTIGVRQPGTSLSRDWLGFGNIKVFYYGQLDEAGETLDSVLSSQSARAKTILEVYEQTIDINDNYAAYPNYSQALKDELQQTLEAVDNTTAPEAKYQLIEKFSELFLQIYECKQAYIHLMDMAEELGDILNSFTEILSDADYNRLYDIKEDLEDGYIDGTMSAEEIYAINLDDYFDFLPELDDEGYYLLRDLEDFNIFALMVNGGKTNINAKLLTDIDLSTNDNPNLMIGTEAAQYAGTFDGQGHTVKYSYTVNDNYGGLFSYLNSATIRNLRVEGDAVVTAIHFGALNGRMNGNVLIENVITDVDIIGDRSDVTGIGGMTGALYGNVTFNNCATLGTMGNPGSSMYCGFTAFATSGVTSTLNNCYTACTLTEGTGLDYCWTFYRGDGQLNNCYFLNKIGQAQGKQMTLEQFQNGEVCYKLNGDQSDIHWYQNIGTDEFPVLDNTHKTVYVAADGSYTNEKAHTGTQDDPFVVKSAADLSNLIKLLISGRMNYVVMENDVDMADVSDWTPLFNIDDQSNGYPYIDFDGKNHVIRNLTSNTTGAYDYCGVFGVLCGNVRNLGVENATVECAGGTGILAGYLGHSTYGQTCYIENVWVTGKVTANGYCGGMFGNIADESHITNCYANVEVTGSGDLTGGIIGRVRNKVVMNNVYAAGTINRGGGIIGGGFQSATPDGSYTNVAVWNNTANNFGPARDTDALSGILYYDGNNFADLQSQVVAWDPSVWSCDMEPGSYPVLAAFDPDDIKGVMADDNSQSTSIYNLAGQRLSKMQKGINIVNGNKILVK